MSGKTEVRLTSVPGAPINPSWLWAMLWLKHASTSKQFVRLGDFIRQKWLIVADHECAELGSSHADEGTECAPKLPFAGADPLTLSLTLGNDRSTPETYRAFEA